MAESEAPVVEIVNVKKQFGDKVVLNGIDLHVMKGEVVAILGPSGSGKSTLLRCVNHLEEVTSGSIKVCGNYIGYERRGDTLREIFGKRLARQRQKVGMVFQHFNLYPHKTALENVIEGPVHVLKTPREQAVARGRELLLRVGLGERVNAYPSELSGGQKQRVAIARALAMDPEVILFDEPTSALDPELVNEVLNVMKEVASLGISMLVVTHEVGFAREVCSRVVFMADGGIVEEGPAHQVIDNPRQQRTREFLGVVPRKMEKVN
ncbi:amino acid ABC transporter ATP-binding protein [Paraburkholderia sp.]|uniref:amino acid ABC transporter ATP-binding protein n=1 Tax=Paraburkholderia sp. TaxID=1926495 RepID=UPI0039E4B036